MYCVNASSLCTQAAIAIGMTLFLNIEGLIDFFSFTAWIFYGAAVAALIRLRWTRPDAPRPFKVRFT
jgi:amino acid transporter